MELAIKTAPTVTFDLPTDNTSGVTATYSKNGSAPVTLSTTTVDDTVTANLPYQDSEGEAVVNWTFTIPGSGTFTDSQVFRVVTPFLSLKEMRELIPEFSDRELTMLESSIRQVIYSIVGQTFGKYVGAYDVQGDDKLTLALPQRILTLNTVNGLDPTDYFVVENEGYSLRHFPWGVPPVNADFFGLHQHVGGVIHNPNNVRLGEFYKSATYRIDGVWGHLYVPEGIKEAARLLVTDYSCADAEYRDRYLTSMTAADWRIQFHDAAFDSTGNARADKILEPYVRPARWAVL
jgi:hypothetical protein